MKAFHDLGIARPVCLQGIRVKFVIMKVIGSRSRSQEQKGRKSLFPQSRSAITPVLKKHRAMKFACSVEFSAMVDRMV